MQGKKTSRDWAPHFLPLLLFLRLIAKISSPRFQAKRPWSALCLLTKQ